MSENSSRMELYQRLVAGEELFEWLQALPLDGLWYLDLDNPDAGWLSPRFKELLGYADHEVPSEMAWWQEHIFDQDLRLLLEAFGRHVKENGSHEQVIRYQHKDGSTVWTRCRALIIGDDNGPPIGMLGAHTDVTALKELEERWRLAVDGTGFGTWSWNIRTGQLVWSDRCKELFGLPADETMSYSRFLEALHPDDREPTNAVVAHSLETGQQYRTEFRAVRPDGSVHWLAASGSAYYDETGEPARMDGVVQDITERKNHERALWESEERLAQAQEAGGIGMFDWDIVQNQAICNPHYFELLGFEPRAGILTREEWLAAVHPDDQARAHEALARTLQEGAPYDIEYRTIDRNGSIRWLTTQAKVLVDDANQPVRMIGAMTDITARKTAEEQIRRYSSELEQKVSERTAELEESRDQLRRINGELETILYITSHDLREPLRAITNFSRIVMEEYGPRLDTKGHDLLGRVVRAAERQDQLLKDLLLLSRAQRLKPTSEPIDGRSVVNKALVQVENRIRESAARVEVKGRFPQFRVDPTWATQAVYNLLTNALKFAPVGKAPEVEITPYIPHTGERDLEGIVVRDRGPGVPEEQRERIFELFRRGVGREVEGTGAGLAIVRRVAEGHGGRAWTQPREGGGSEFVITFGTGDPANSEPVAVTAGGE